MGLGAKNLVGVFFFAIELLGLCLNQTPVFGAGGSVASSNLVKPALIANLSGVGSRSDKIAILNDILFVAHGVGQSNSDGARLIGLDRNGTVVYSTVLANSASSSSVNSQMVYGLRAFKGSIYVGTSPDGSIWKFTPSINGIPTLKKLVFSSQNLISGTGSSCITSIRDRYIFDFTELNGKLYAGAYPCSDIFLVDDVNELAQWVGSAVSLTDQTKYGGKTYSRFLFTDSKNIYSADIYGFLHTSKDGTLWQVPDYSKALNKLYSTPSELPQLCIDKISYSVEAKDQSGNNYVWSIYQGPKKIIQNNSCVPDTSAGGTQISIAFKLDGSQEPTASKTLPVADAQCFSSSPDSTSHRCIASVTIPSVYNSKNSIGEPIGFLNSSLSKSSVVQFCDSKYTKLPQIGPVACKINQGSLTSVSYVPKITSESGAGFQTLFRIYGSPTGAITASGQLPGYLARLTTDPNTLQHNLTNYGSVAEGEVYSFLQVDSKTMLLGLYSGPARVAVVDLKNGSVRAINGSSADELGWRPQSAILAGPSNEFAVFGAIASYTKVTNGGKIVVYKTDAGVWTQFGEIAPFSSTQQSIGSLVYDGENTVFVASDNERNSTIGPVGANVPASILGFQPGTMKISSSMSASINDTNLGPANAIANLVKTTDGIFGVARFWADWTTKKEKAGNLLGKQSLFKLTKVNSEIQINLLLELPADCKSNIRSAYQSMAQASNNHLIGLCQFGYFDYDPATSKINYRQFVAADGSKVAVTSGFALVNNILFFGSAEKLMAIKVVP